MNIGERIKQRRKELGISAETLAMRVGKSPATIYRYENGSIRKKDSDILILLADALSTTPTALMGLEDSQDTLHDIGQQLTAPSRSSEWRMLSEGLAKLEIRNNAAFQATANYLSAMYPDIFAERNDDDANDTES